ncbi:hypothetical protein OE88DRAFT_1665828 [Heliocybe sulcata]|uniref:Lysozyme inhibitor LprI N-terminal domain-containing protein n=1 Tax=Heliocybe sulcata TaxID=5364 RepID=A0A5C3MUX5_9AGAM|nr:hypothetical protein OE88DRAFT_1665828 [Heliocybe sulcata]
MFWGLTRLRSAAAIALTLCEVATARHHSVPMECVPLGSGAQGAPGDCVEALSRSAQFWSSYSGYLREVPQLCYAFRRWNDIDTAKDIYRNATLEKLALIRLLVDREKSLKRTQEQWESLRIVNPAASGTAYTDSCHAGHGDFAWRSSGIGFRIQRGIASRFARIVGGTARCEVLL